MSGRSQASGRARSWMGGVCSRGTRWRPRRYSHVVSGVDECRCSCAGHLCCLRKASYQLGFVPYWLRSADAPPPARGQTSLLPRGGKKGKCRRRAEVFQTLVIHLNWCPERALPSNAAGNPRSEGLPLKAPSGKILGRLQRRQACPRRVLSSRESCQAVRYHMHALCQLDISRYTRDFDFSAALAAASCMSNSSCRDLNRAKARAEQERLRKRLEERVHAGEAASR